MAIKIEGVRGGLSDTERAQIRKNNNQSSAPKLTPGEKRLLDSKVTDLMPVYRKKNDEDEEVKGVFLAKLEGGKKAIFKICNSPVHGKDCSCSKAEAAYFVDKALKLDLVPTTVIREVKDTRADISEVGSLQDYVENQGSGEDITLTPDELIKIRIFHYIIYGYDQHEGNYLSTSTGIKSVDNERSFSVEPELATETKNLLTNQLEEIEDLIIPDEILDILKDFLTNPISLNRLERKLSGLIGEKDAKATIERIHRIHNSISRDNKLTAKDIEELMS